MKVIISKSQLNNVTIPVICSKSVAHRMLIAASLCDNEVALRINAYSEDINATVNVLEQLGAQYEQKDDILLVKRSLSHRLADRGAGVEFDCNESGSTARFILTLSSLLYEKVKMTGRGKLPQRPFAPLNNALREHGLIIDSDYLPLNISGRLAAGDYYLPGDVSSQYISGLLFALPLLEGDSRIILTTKLTSKDYVAITLDVLKRFGVDIVEGENEYIIRGNQRYVAKDKLIDIEGDWSNAAFLLGVGALDNKITVAGLNHKSHQGDKEIMNALAYFGAKLAGYMDADGRMCYEVSHNKLNGIRIDADNIPDMVPALSVIAAYAVGDTYIEHVERLRIKESNRIESVTAVVRALGGDVTLVDNADSSDMIIHPVTIASNEDVIIDSYNDHRIVMCAALAAAAGNRRIVINNAEAVNKSYPGFFEAYRQIGFEVTVSDDT